MPINGFFDKIFGVDGDLQVVPDAPQPDGSVSYDQGYPIAYSTPVASGGKNIPRGTINQLLYDITSAIQQYQKHSTAPFITSTMNGGTPYSYSKYDRVLLSGVVYQSLVNTNTDTPPSSNWAISDIGATNTYTAATTTGTANAQIAGTTNPVATAFTTGQSVTCTAGFTNTTSMTFGAGGETPIVVKKNTTAGLVVLSGNEFFAGNKYVMVKDTVASCWILESGAPYLQPNLNLADLTNIATALTSLTILFSLAASGYMKVGNFIIQWGSGSATSGNWAVTFPTTFTTACYVALPTVGSNFPVNAATGYNSLTTSGCNFVVNNFSSSAISPAMSYIAIGK